MNGGSSKENKEVLPVCTLVDDSDTSSILENYENK
jgi:hypothetical protein